MVKKPEDQKHWYYRFSMRGASSRSIEQSCTWRRVPNDPRNMAEAYREVRVLLGKKMAAKVEIRRLEPSFVVDPRERR